MMKITAVQIEPSKLHKLLVGHFNLDELRTLCFDLQLDFEELPPGGKSAVARELVEYCQRRRLQVALAEAVLEHRPRISSNEFTRDISFSNAPFKGMLAFEEADEEIFFGREELTAELVARVSQPPGGSIHQPGPPPNLREVSHEPTNFLAIVGASGSGKSSVVKAGMIPQLRRQTNWPIHLITPTAHPLQALATSLTRDSESVTATATLLDDLQAESRALRLYAARMLQNNPADRLLLVIDQFEELFTLCKDEAERTAFVENLVGAVTEDSQITILLTLRADFYAQCLKYEPLHRLLEQQQKIVPTMSSAELRAAIELPAQQTNLTFDNGLVDILLRDVGAADNQTPEPGALPLLSHALLETWQRRNPAENRLTLAGYTEAGGVQGAIAKTAESTYQRLPADQQKIARSIFLRLTELGEGTQDTRRRAALAELLPQNDSRTTVEQVLKTLADARLLTTSNDGAEVAHEALIRQWPTLQSWLNEDRDGLRLHRQLTEAALAWEINHRDGSYLYRGGRLTQIRDWVETDATPLNQQETAFLRASQQQQRDELAEANARAEREADAAQKLRQRALFLRGALVLAAALAVAAFLLFGNANRSANEARNAEAAAQIEIVARTTAEAQAIENESLAETRAAEAESAEAAAVVAEANAFDSANVATTREADAIAAQTEAERQRRIALAQSLAAISSVVVEQQDNDTELAVLLAIEGTGLNRDAKGSLSWLLDDVLRTRLTDNFFNTTLRGHELRVTSVAFSPDGQTLASGSTDGTVRLWNLDTPGEEPVVLQHESSIGAVAFSPDGQMLASGGSDNMIRLWDLNNPQEEPVILRGQDGSITSVAFSPDGQILASGSGNLQSGDHTVGLWNLGSPEMEPVILRGHRSIVWSVAFSPDGQKLASGGGDLQLGDDNTVRLWDLSNLEADPVILEGHESRITSVAFSPDGHMLASGSYDYTIRLWNLNNPEVESVMLSESIIESVVFSPDGQMLASGNGDNTVRLWNLSVPEVESVILRGHESNVNSVAFSPDGLMLASGSDDHTSNLWDLRKPDAEFVILEGQGAWVRAVAFSADGQMLASGSGDDVSNDTIVRLWNMANLDAEPLVLRGHESGLRSVAFNPNSNMLASGSDDQTIRLWDLNNLDREPVILRGHESSVLSVAFSPDGQLLASGSADQTIRLWDVNNPEREPIELLGHEGNVWSVNISPDGQMLASGSIDQTIRLWDLSHPEAEPIILRGHDQAIRSVAFSLDGRTLASGSDDHAVFLWELSNLKAAPVMLLGHEAAVFSVAFSPDGQTLASGSSDKTVRIWDLNNLEAPSIVLQGHESGVWSVAFSPDEQRLASGSGDFSSQDNTIRLWVFLEELVEIGCQKVRRNLSWEEWQRYLPGEPYRQTCPNLPPHSSVPVEELQ